jgi:hypothetical protein
MLSARYGDLHIDGQSRFRWYQCKTTYVEESIAPSRSGALLALSPDSDCRLDDSSLTRIPFVRVANQTSPCEPKITAYTSDADMQNTDRTLYRAIPILHNLSAGSRMPVSARGSCPYCLYLRGDRETHC